MRILASRLQKATREDVDVGTRIISRRRQSKLVDVDTSCGGQSTNSERHMFKRCLQGLGERRQREAGCLQKLQSEFFSNEWPCDAPICSSNQFAELLVKGCTSMTSSGAQQDRGDGEGTRASSIASSPSPRPLYTPGARVLRREDRWIRNVEELRLRQSRSAVQSWQEPYQRSRLRDFDDFEDGGSSRMGRARRQATDKVSTY